MTSAPNARGPETYILGLRQAFLVGIFGARKLAGKGGKSRETGGEHVALPARTLQSLVPTQR